MALLSPTTCELKHFQQKEIASKFPFAKLSFQFNDWQPGERDMSRDEFISPVGGDGVVLAAFHTREGVSTFISH